MKRITSILLVVLFTGTVLSHAETAYIVEDDSIAPKSVGVMHLSLQEALEMALLNNFDVQLARYDRMINHTDLNDSMSTYDTVLRLAGDYTSENLQTATALASGPTHDGDLSASLAKQLRTGTELELEYGIGRHSSGSSFITTNPYYETYVKGTLVQPLLKNIWGNNDWRDVLVTRIDVDMYDSEVIDTIESSLVDVEKAYWGLVISHETVKVTEELLNKAQSFYDTVKQNEELGSVEETDLLSAEANLISRQTNLLTAQNSLKNSVNDLKLVINISGDISEIAPINNLRMDGVEELLEESIAAAFKGRRDYVRKRRNAESKELKLQTAKNERWPQLDLEASLKLNGIKRSFIGSERNLGDKLSGEYYAGATFSMPLENREAVSAANKAKYEKARSLVELAQLEKSIIVEIDEKVRRVNLDVERLRRREKTEGLQKRKMEAEEKKYRYGRSDSDRIVRFQEDYLNASLQVLLMKTDAINSLLDLYLSENTYLDKRDLVAE